MYDEACICILELSFTLLNTTEFHFRSLSDQRIQILQDFATTVIDLNLGENMNIFRCAYGLKFCLGCLAVKT